MLAVTYGLRELLRTHPRVKISIPGHYRRLVAEVNFQAIWPVGFATKTEKSKTKAHLEAVNGKKEERRTCH